MRIGIRPITEHRAGGNFQYGRTMLETLCESDQYDLNHADNRDEYIVFYHPNYTLPILPAGCSERWSLCPLPLLRHEYLLSSVRSRVRTAVSAGRVRESSCTGGHGNRRADITYEPKKRRYLEWRIRRLKIDLMLYPSPIAESFEIRVPFVIAIHDLQHLLQPHFPEVSADGQFEMREYLYRNVARYATLILADSAVGREDILRFYEPYGVREDQVKVLPFLPADYLQSDVSASELSRVRQFYELPERYLFYPANFWPHKNHVRIVEAIGKLKREAHLDVCVVFTGTSTDAFAHQTLADVNAMAARWDVRDAVLHLGHIPDSDMSALYTGACALVMPTFFGPTNIPVLEAWALGCPVLTSDIRGVREQVGEAGLLVRPESVEEIADAIRKLWTDEDLRQDLISLGRKRLSAYTREDYRRQLNAVVDEAKVRITSDRHLRPL